MQTRRKKIIKIVLVNQPMGNRGDESAHRALVRNLLNTYPDVQIELLVRGFTSSQIEDIMVNSTNMKYTKVNSSRGEFRIIDWALSCGCKLLLKLIPSIRTITKIFNDASIVICAPGGICMGGFQNWEHVYVLQIAKMMKKPIAYYGRSIGPFATKTELDRKFRKYSYDLLHYFDFISLRDNKSVMIAADEGIDYISTVDTAFLDSPNVEIPFRIHQQIGKNRYVIFVPNSLTWHYDFKKKKQELIDRFFIGLLNEILKSDSNIKILMLPQLHSFTHKDDKYYFADLLEKIKSDRIELIDDMYSSDIQQTIISNAEYVVGARYHSVVFAINQAVPFISLSYEHKMKGLLETLGIEDWMVDITNIFTDEDKVDAAIANVMEKINNIPKNVRQCKEWQHKAKFIAADGFDKLKTFISSIKVFL